MSDSDNSKSESESPAKEAKSHSEILSSHQVIDNKKERQQRYREKNREKLKQREAERRKRMKYFRSIAESSTSSSTNGIESNNEEIIFALSQRSSSFNVTQTSSIRRNQQISELSTLQKRRERQQRYREKHREKLKQREAERRRRQRNSEMITSPNADFTVIINEPMVDKISTNPRNVTGLREMQHAMVGVSQQNKKGQQNIPENLLFDKNGQQLSSPRTHMPHLKKIKVIDKVTPLMWASRLCPHNLTTFQRLITDLMNSRNELTIHILDCQRPRKRTTDLQDSLYQNSNFLLLTEKWLSTDESVDLPNFDCIAKFKRRIVRTAEVSIYKNNNTSHITTLNMELAVQDAREIDVSQTSVGDVCASHVRLGDGRELIMIVVYIAPDKKIKDIISFLHERLFLYSYRGSVIFGSKKHRLPLILAGDFNVNFTKKESMPLITFLQEEFQLQVNMYQSKSNLSEHTSRCGTTIDAVFIRHLNKVISNHFVTYFSYHRPIVTVNPLEAISNIAITEVTS